MHRNSLLNARWMKQLLIIETIFLQNNCVEINNVPSMQSETKLRPLISNIKWYDQSLFNWRCRASFITFLNLISGIVKSPAEGKLISRWPECLSLKYNAKKWNGSTTINLASKLRKRSNFLVIWPHFENVKYISIILSLWYSVF